MKTVRFFDYLENKLKERRKGEIQRYIEYANGEEEKKKSKRGREKKRKMKSIFKERRKGEIQR